MYKEKMAKAIEEVERLNLKIAEMETEALLEVRHSNNKARKVHTALGLTPATGNEPYEMAQILKINFYYKQAENNRNYQMAVAQMYATAALVEEADLP